MYVSIMGVEHVCLIMHVEHVRISHACRVDHVCVNMRVEHVCVEHVCEACMCRPCVWSMYVSSCVSSNFVSIMHVVWIMYVSTMRVEHVCV